MFDTREELQKYLNKRLVEVIKDVEALGYQVQPIEPNIRITNNKQRLGSAKIVVANYHSHSKDSFEQCSLFRISISTNVCVSDSDINDTLYHEVIHCIKGCFNHGKKFKEVASKVNFKYKTNVKRVRKDKTTKNKQVNKVDGMTLLNDYIGKEFTYRKTKYRFDGFNGRPKKCCDITRLKDGVQMVGPVELLIKVFGL